MADLEDADAVAEVMWHFQNDPEVLQAIGGVDHISGITEGPWPHLLVYPGPGGSLRDLLASIEPDVQVEVIGPMDGSIGSADLWRLAMKVLRSAKRLPERDQPPGRPVVSNVRLTGGLSRQPLASGQIKWGATLNVTISPPQAIPA